MDKIIYAYKVENIRCTIFTCNNIVQKASDMNTFKMNHVRDNNTTDLRVKGEGDQIQVTLAV